MNITYKCLKCGHLFLHVKGDLCMTVQSSDAPNVIQSLLFQLKSYNFSKGSPNIGTF